jgi:C4-dicarboxylate-specific signal transduction histidine kinase
MGRPETVEPEDFIRLTALEELLGGVAHEINQPLNAIMIASQVIRLRVERSHLAEDQEAFLTERLDLISSQAMKAAQIVEKFRNLGASDESGQGETRFRELFDHIRDLMGQQFVSRGIDLNCEIHDPTPLVKGPPQPLLGIMVQALAFARDTVQAIGNWHDKNDIAYKRSLKVTLSDEQGRCVFHLDWDRGQISNLTDVIDPTAYAGLKAADSILSSGGGGLKLYPGALRIVFSP